MVDKKKASDFSEAKKKASDFIGTFSMGLEKVVHKTIDKTGEFTGFVKDSIKDSFESFSGGVEDFIEMIKQVDVATLSPGDLVISKEDIKQNGAILHSAGEVFEFSEDMIPLLGKSPLFIPDMKTAVKYARLDELKRVSKKVIPDGNPALIKDYIKIRTEEIKNPKVEEPAHA